MAAGGARLTLPPMVTNLDDEFRFHATALNLRAQRQQVLASNIANAATPGFKARDLDFSAALSQALAGQSSQGQSSGAHLSATSARHLPAPSAAPGITATSLSYRMPAQASIDGNTVEMDAERAHFAENAVRYEANLTVLGMQIKQILSAIQG